MGRKSQKQISKSKKVIKDTLRTHKYAALGLLFVALLAGTIAVKPDGDYEPEVLPPPPENALYTQPNAPIEERVADLLSHMSLDEKIGQMALVDKNSLKNIDDTRKYRIGAVLSGAGAKPADNTPRGWVNMVASYKTAASNSRLKIPILYGIDAGHGHSNIPGATVFPHFIGLGASGDVDLVKRVAAATAMELDATGVNWSYSPNLDAPKDIRWGRVYEAFSDDPKLIASLGQAYVTGLQESPVSDDSKTFVLATAKHYLGTGSMLWGESDNKDFEIDQGKTAADEQALTDEYLPPFAAASDANTSSIMVGLHKWGDGTIITNQYLLTDKLKNEVGFKGFLVSDWYGVYERAGNKYNATVKAINAGLDMAMLPYDYKSFIRDVHRAVDRGDISKERIDDAVTRILRQKFQAGLFEESIKTTPTPAKIGAAEHRTVAREAVAKSSVLLKNKDNLLPLAKSSNSILIAGSGADNIGRQSGAWTVEWQGIDGNWLPGGTSVLRGIKSKVERSTTVRYDRDADFVAGTKAAIGIAVVSEKPYAEGWGDNANPTISKEDREVIKKLRALSDKVVVVIISGRPLLLNNDQENWDALVASWLPGSEGAGIADVLFGDKPFTAKLPLPWPASLSQIPVASDGSTADSTPLLYPRGHGLASQ